MVSTEIVLLAVVVSFQAVIVPLFTATSCFAAPWVLYARSTPLALFLAGGHRGAIGVEIAAHVTTALLLPSCLGQLHDRIEGRPVQGRCRAELTKFVPTAETARRRGPGDVGRVMPTLELRVERPISWSARC